MEAEIERTQNELLAASASGVVEIAADVLRNVGNILKNADVSAPWFRPGEAIQDRQCRPCRQPDTRNT